MSVLHISHQQSHGAQFLLLGYKNDVKIVLKTNMKIFGTFYPDRFDDKNPLKSRKHIKLCFDDFYANFGVPYLSNLFISMTIPAAAVVLLLQEKYTEEIVTCLNQKC